MGLTTVQRYCAACDRFALAMQVQLSFRIEFMKLSRQPGYMWARFALCYGTVVLTVLSVCRHIVLDGDRGVTTFTKLGGSDSLV